MDTALRFEEDLKALSAIFEVGDRTVPEESADEDEPSPEDDLFREAGKALLNLVGRSYPAATQGARLVLSRIRRPVADDGAEDLEFVVPLVVSWEGKAPPESWREAEDALEGEVQSVLSGVLAGFGDDDGDPMDLEFVRRRKTDPFPDSPESLTMLRYRVA